MDYAEQDGTVSSSISEDFNGYLLNCMQDAVPIGVMVKDGTGHKVLGLAYVERHNAATHMFTLHGPVNYETDRERLFDVREFNRAEYTKFLREESAYGASVEEDLRKHKLIEQVRREHQEAFRSELLAAYGNRCAITGADVPEALQAAHIASYRGVQTQYVNNGLLLRADMHLLFDAHLLAVDPDNDKLRLSTRLEGTQYERFNCRRVRKPEDPKLWPDEDLLGMNFDEFRLANKVLAAC